MPKSKVFIEGYVTLTTHHLKISHMKNKIKDTIGTSYQFFLKFMILLQITFIYYDYDNGNYIFSALHLLVCFYFIFRLHVFIQMKQTAHKNGKTLIEYLDEIKNCR